RHFLAGVLVVPLIQFQPTLDEEGAALAKVLSDDLGLLSPCVDVDEGHLLPALAGFRPVGAVDRQSEPGDGLALGCVPQFGIASEVPEEDNLVEAGHGRSQVVALTAGPALVNITRKTSSLSLN